MPFVTGGGGGSSGPVSALTKAVGQAGHGFIVGDVVRSNSANQYTKAQATSVANAQVVGIVSEVAGVDNFTLLMSGYTTALAGLVSGTVYYLDATTAGAVTSTKPAGYGQPARPVYVSISGTDAILIQGDLEDNSVSTFTTTAIRKLTGPGSTTINSPDGDYMIVVDNSGGGGISTVNLPASPTDGQNVVVKDSGGNAATWNIVINGNGKNIDGSGTYTINSNRQSVTLVYSADVTVAGEWVIV